MNRDPRSRSRQWQARMLAAAVAAGIALLAAACDDTPHTAGTSTSPGGLTAQDVDTFMQCMRSHGMTNFYLSRPGSAGSGPSNTLGLEPYGVVYGVDFSSPQFQSASKACQHLLPGPPAPALTSAQLRKLVQAAACMRGHGYPGYPDPTVQHDHLVPVPLPSSIDTSSPQFLARLKACSA